MASKDLFSAAFAVPKDKKNVKPISMTTMGVVVAGGLVVGSTFLGAMTTPIAASTVYPVATACVVWGSLLDQLFAQKEKYKKIFKACSLVNTEGKLPIVVKKERKDNIITLVIHMPEGLSQKHFEAKQQELEQALNARIEFGFNKNLIMKLISFNLGTRYEYEFEETDSPTKIFIGYNHEGKVYFDLDEAVQTLVAGEPKAGKSSFERTIGLSICMSKYDVDLHLIDFQGIELGIFQDCKKVKTYGETPEDFDKLMDLLGKESEERLKLFASVKKKHFIQNLAVWNKFYPERALPYKIILIDEFSRISENEDLLNKFRIRVAMDRKAGILYVASMQRPDVKIISGSIKGNMPTRVAFKTVTDTDSEVILDVEGAEKIKNRGRCIMKYCGTLQEVQVLYIEPDDVREYFKKYKLQKTEEDLQIERKIEMATRQKHCVNPYRKPECFAIDDKVIIISGECKGCKGTFVDAIAGRDGCNLKVHLYETLNGKAIDKTINCSETDLTHLYV